MVIIKIKNELIKFEDEILDMIVGMLGEKMKFIMRNHEISEHVAIISLF